MILHDAGRQLRSKRAHIGRRTPNLDDPPLARGRSKKNENMEFAEKK